ncbi:mitochondrial nicotinamide adenine dinucleotide transporter [Acrasis kona]|uniref:Mitochondrial nicotinamide adenine dinucleotide transporter n=1 Tax=Acrasis kona TaxID=1008807 RepID=A0AAW2ZC41_9EUKA
MSVTPEQHQWINLISGSISGAVAAVSLAPLDVVKTRLIVQRQFITNGNEPQFTGIIQTMKRMYNIEGFKSLYRGVGPQTLGYIPNWAVYFTTVGYLFKYSH